MARRIYTPPPLRETKPEIKVRYVADSPESGAPTVHSLRNYHTLERVIQDSIKRVNRR